MPRHLTEDDIEVLVRTIDALAVATWDAVVKLARQRLGHAYSRQTLSRHPRIRTALTARKEQLKRKQPPRRPRPKTDTEAASSSVSTHWKQRLLGSRPTTTR